MRQKARAHLDVAALVHLRRKVREVRTRGNRGQHGEYRKEEEDRRGKDSHLDGVLLVRNGRQPLHERPASVVLDEHDEVVRRKKPQRATMSVEEREVPRHRAVELAESANGVERERKYRERDGHQDNALDDVRDEHAPKSARERIDKHDRRAERDADRERHTEELRGDDAKRVETHRVVEDAERDAAPREELTHARTVAAFKVFDGRCEVRPLPPPREDERADEDGERRGPEHRHAHESVLVSDLRVGDEHEAADHRHVRADRAHPPRDHLAAREEVLRPLHEPPHAEAHEHCDREIRPNDDPI